MKWQFLLGLLSMIVTSALKADAEFYRVGVRFNLVDAVTKRRLSLNLTEPRYSRHEIVGAGQLFLNGVSDDLVYRIDVISNSDDGDSGRAFIECAELAKEAATTGKGITLYGESKLLPKREIKSVVLIEKLVGCRIND